MTNAESLQEAIEVVEQEGINTSRWLIENAVLLASQYMLGTHLGQKVWCIGDHQFDEIVEQLTRRGDEFCIGGNGRFMYLTTGHGFVAVDQLGIPNKDIFNCLGHRILLMEISRTRWFSEDSVYVKWCGEITTQDMINRETHIAEQAAAELRKVEEQKAKIQAVEKHFRSYYPNRPDYQQVVDAAMGFDHLSTYNGDMNRWRKSEEQRKKIVEGFEYFGINGNEALREISKAHGAK